MSKTWRKHDGTGKRQQNTKDHRKSKRQDRKVDLTSDKED